MLASEALKMRTRDQVGDVILKDRSLFEWDSFDTICILFTEFPADEIY